MKEETLFSLFLIFGVTSYRFSSMTICATQNKKLPKTALKLYFNELLFQAFKTLLN